MAAAAYIETKREAAERATARIKAGSTSSADIYAWREYHDLLLRFTGARRRRTR